jgi:DNA repair protein RadA/Sms
MPAKMHRCSNCGHTQVDWDAKCPICGEYNTMDRVEASAAAAGKSSTGKTASARSVAAATGNKPKSVKDIRGQRFDRIPVGVGEFDRVLGGGLVPGGVILLAGSPGSGKSTISLVAAKALTDNGKKVLIVSGEETQEQIAERAERLGTINQELYLMSESNLSNALAAIEELRPDFFVIDSLQTLVSADSESRIGSPTQVNDVANGVVQTAKRMGIPALIIGHVTKEGSIAGPRVVEHLVDTVLYFESSGDSPLRILRGIKNRFGATDVTGVFEHVEDGFVEVPDPSGYFLTEHEKDVTGYAASIMLEGNRALPVEIQALVAPSKLPNPRKVSNGLDNARVLMIQAILQKHTGLNLSEKDVYVSTTGGAVLRDSAADLAIAAAIISSAKNITVPHGSLFIGETTLTGEVRPAKDVKRRAAEGRRLGFHKVFEPYTNKELTKTDLNVSTIRELALYLLAHGKELKESAGIED